MSYQTIPEIIKNNTDWAEKKTQEDPEYFANLSKNQKPAYLWIGCSDSRVPPNTVTGTEPGEIFIHRNIANMVVSTDLNLLSVLEYAVDHLHVEHVIVCGHYNCGGIKAAMGNQSLGLLDKWLLNIKSVYRMHATELNSYTDLDKRADRLAELNVQEQVINLAGTSVIQKAWKNRKKPSIHGWVYDLYNGKIKQIYSMDSNSILNDIFEYQNL
jgi:carbonic anhydrase